MDWWINELDDFIPCVDVDMNVLGLLLNTIYLCIIYLIMKKKKKNMY